MIVQIMKKTYKMGKKEYDGLMKIAKEKVPFGVYAVKKNDTTIMLNEKCNSKNQLRNIIKEYKAKGFKVYSNGL